MWWNDQICLLFLHPRIYILTTKNSLLWLLFYYSEAYSFATPENNLLCPIYTYL